MNETDIIQNIIIMILIINMIIDNYYKDRIRKLNNEFYNITIEKFKVIFKLIRYLNKNKIRK